MKKVVVFLVVVMCGSVYGLEFNDGKIHDIDYITDENIGVFDDPFWGIELFGIIL